MKDVEKQIEEVMELVQDLMNAQSSSQRIREKKTLESKLRTLLSSAQPALCAITAPRDRANTIYVSGPMTGHKDLNFPAFNAAAQKLRDKGCQVINPADHGEVPGATWADYLRHDLAQLVQCEAIHLLPGWSKSRGAMLEHYVAAALGLRVEYAGGAELEAAHIANPAPALEVTPAMVAAASEAYCPFGDMELAIHAALLAASQPNGEVA